MEIVRRVRSMRETFKQVRTKGQRIGFVPTMGFLHQGHVALIRKMREQTDIVVVSIFVNPAQFGPGEDFESYPRDLTRDTDLCIREGVDYLLAPEAKEIYPPGPRTYVEIPDLSASIEGASRPGHFRGVATVVLKLINIVQPHAVAFGQKDAQQAIVIRRMVEDLMLGLELHIVPTVRDERGLALSSRNKYLTPAFYEAALAIPRSLEAARHVVGEGQTKPEEVLAAVQEVLAAEPLVKIDYVELVDPKTMEPVELIEGPALLLVAAALGETRLLDNATISPPEDR
jgi:pantoate--beta-alanine ligase